MRTVLLTGGTGSFGQGFVNLLLAQESIGMVRVYSRDEHKQRVMRSHVRKDGVSFYLGDVRDKDRLRRVMEGCDYVVHAAALKQAPVGEVEPQEFIKTNINGSVNVVEAALDCGVEKALLVSTDKAVEPINLYGATKMCAERVFLQADMMNAHKRTRFACTRYGNVVGTSGSVIPFFQSLPYHEDTPVCDPDSTRFLISLQEANKFVWDSLMNMRGGEVFIPKMKTARVVDIAKAIRPDANIKVVGARDGDKTHEVLSLSPRYASNENPMSVQEIREYVAASL